MQRDEHAFQVRTSRSCRDPCIAVHAVHDVTDNAWKNNVMVLREFYGRRRSADLQERCRWNRRSIRLDHVVIITD